MSKICTKCSKTVYPLEELKCLDKIWHKTCFKCWECGMTLNMKNYKGFDKKPYCSAHYPKTTATVVAETPELARIAHNTKIQSQVKYHEEFEKNIKGYKTAVVDDCESRRLKRLGSLVSQVEYKRSDSATRRSSLTHIPADSPSEMDVLMMRRQTTQSTSSTTDSDGGPAVRQRIGSIADYDPINEQYGSLTQGYQPRSRGSASLASQSYEWQETVDIQPTDNVQHSQPVITSPPHIVNSEEMQVGLDGTEHQQNHDAAAAAETETDTLDNEAEHIDGQHHDVDDAAATADGDDDAGDVQLNAGDSANQPVMLHRPDDAAETVADKLDDEAEAVAEHTDVRRHDVDDADDGDVHLNTVDSAIQPVMPRHDDVDDDNAAAADETLTDKLDNEAEHTDSRHHDVDENAAAAADDDDDDDADESPSVDSHGQPTQSPTAEDADIAASASVPSNSSLTGDTEDLFVALYSYDAGDSDEVSFTEGDRIVRLEQVDDGWMYGRVQATGQLGMLPANYVEPLSTD